MQIEKKTKTVSEEYCCSNPNCKTVFSQPKIIKYYVCPKCQSFAEMEGVSSQPVIVDPMGEENLCLLEEYHSLKSKKLEEIEYLKANIKNKIEEIQKQKIENVNINKKLDDTKKDLGVSKRKFESINRKLEEKDEELAEVVEKNLGLIKRVELFEAARESDSLKIREDAGRLAGLEEKLSEKDGYVIGLDKRLAELREEVEKLKKQRDDALRDKNDVIAEKVKVERKACQELEAKTKIQGELTAIREKIANSIRKEDVIAEKRDDSKRLQDLELETKILRDNKQTTKVQTKELKDVEFENPVAKTEDSDANKINREQQKKSSKVQDLPDTKFTYPEQTMKKEDEALDTTSNNGCSFYFGYLSEREKGEGIPNTCVECSKSIDCMLSKVHKSNESVKEIKKWYHFK